jgi:hypothetical protein
MDYGNRVCFRYRGNPTANSYFQGKESEFRLDSGRFTARLDLLDIE